MPRQTLVNVERGVVGVATRETLGCARNANGPAAGNDGMDAEDRS